MYFNKVNTSLSNIIKLDVMCLQATEWENEEPQKIDQKVWVLHISDIFYDYTNEHLIL